MAYLGKALFLAGWGSKWTVTRSAKERIPRLYTASGITVSRRQEYGIFLGRQTTRAVFSPITTQLAKGFKPNSLNRKSFRLLLCQNWRSPALAGP